MIDFKKIVFISSLSIFVSIHASAPDDRDLSACALKSEVCSRMNRTGDAQWDVLDPRTWDPINGTMKQANEIALYSAACDLYNGFDKSEYIHRTMDPKKLAEVLNCPLSEVEADKKGKLKELGNRIHRHLVIIRAEKKDKNEAIEKYFDDQELRTDNVQIEVCRRMNAHGEALWKEIDPDAWDDDREREFVMYSAASDLALRNVDYSTYINYNMKPDLLAKVLKCHVSEVEGSKKGKLIELGKRIQKHEPAVTKAIQDKKDKEKQKRIKDALAKVEKEGAQYIRQSLIPDCNLEKTVYFLSRLFRSMDLHGVTSYKNDFEMYCHARNKAYELHGLKEGEHKILADILKCSEAEVRAEEKKKWKELEDKIEKHEEFLKKQDLRPFACNSQNAYESAQATASWKKPKELHWREKF